MTLADDIRAYELWKNTLTATPEDFVVWRQREELWNLFAGDCPIAEIEVWWEDNGGSSA